VEDRKENSYVLVSESVPMVVGVIYAWNVQVSNPRAGAERNRRILVSSFAE
jgi:hypothetical protein